MITVNKDVNKDALTDILQIAINLIKSRTVFIGTLDDVFSIMKIVNSEGGSLLHEGLTLPIELSICNLVTCEESLVISDTKCDVRTKHLQAIYDADVGSYLGAPIVLENGKLFGTLCAVDPNPQTFTEQEVSSIKRLANVLGTIISQQQQVIVPEFEEKMQHLDKLALVGQLAAGLAHEIRNPMQSVKGFIQFLFEEHNETSSHIKDLVLTELNRMNELISDFLLVTQPTAPKKSLTSITDVMQATIGVLQSEANLHNISICLETDDHVPKLWLDASQMKQVFLNIIKNAIEAIGHNGKIGVYVQNKGDTICLFIKDSGPGIPLSIINKIGDPFFSTKDEGVGLGLSICQSIIKEHQGFMSIANDYEGTVVSIQLPATI